MIWAGNFYPCGGLVKTFRGNRPLPPALRDRGGPTSSPASSPLKLPSKTITNFARSISLLVQYTISKSVLSDTSMIDYSESSSRTRSLTRSQMKRTTEIKALLLYVLYSQLPQNGRHFHHDNRKTYGTLTVADNIAMNASPKNIATLKLFFYKLCDCFKNIFHEEIVIAVYFLSMAVSECLIKQINKRHAIGKNNSNADTTLLSTCTLRAFDHEYPRKAFRCAQAVSRACP